MKFYQYLNTDYLVDSSYLNDKGYNLFRFFFLHHVEIYRENDFIEFLEIFFNFTESELAIKVTGSRYLIIKMSEIKKANVYEDVTKNQCEEFKISFEVESLPNFFIIAQYSSLSYNDLTELLHYLKVNNVCIDNNNKNELSPDLKKGLLLIISHELSKKERSILSKHLSNNCDFALRFLDQIALKPNEDVIWGFKECDYFEIRTKTVFERTGLSWERYPTEHYKYLKKIDNNGVIILTTKNFYFFGTNKTIKIDLSKMIRYSLDVLPYKSIDDDFFNSELLYIMKDGTSAKPQLFSIINDNDFLQQLIKALITTYNIHNY